MTVPEDSPLLQQGHRAMLPGQTWRVEGIAVTGFKEDILEFQSTSRLDGGKAILVADVVNSPVQPLQPAT